MTQGETSPTGAESQNATPPQKAAGGQQPQAAQTERTGAKMAFNDKSVLTGTVGNIFMADPETAVPTGGVKLFTVDADTVDSDKWKAVGYLSADTLPEIAVDGGDSTTKAVWQKQNFRTNYDPTTGKLTFTSVQCDADTIATLFSGKKDTDGGVAFSLSKKSVEKALFVVWQDLGTGERSGYYIPKAAVAFSTLPTPSTEDYTNYEITADVLDSTTLPKDDSGRSTNIKWYDAESFSKAA